MFINMGDLRFEPGILITMHIVQKTGIHGYM